MCVQAHHAGMHDSEMIMRVFARSSVKGSSIKDKVENDWTDREWTACMACRIGREITGRNWRAQHDMTNPLGTVQRQAKGKGRVMTDGDEIRQPGYTTPRTCSSTRSGTGTMKNEETKQAHSPSHHQQTSQAKR